MSERLTPVIGPGELLKLRGDESLRLFDASNNPRARANYEARHLAGAAFVDVNADLADIKASPADGGRHPLPAPKRFAETLVALGVSPSSRVVIYDDKSGANAAARFWWMLRAAGHERVQVLDGGIEAAVRAGFPVAEGNERPAAASYDAAEWNLPTADVAEVERASADGGALIVDVRETPRYNGETEPFDKVAGHIPNAVNVPFARNLDADGFFLPPEQLRELYAPLLAGRDGVIVHCGSGVTACHTLLAIDRAGLPMPKLYVGSWSEWSSRGLPVATAGDE